MLITSNTSSGIYPDWWQQWKYSLSPYCFLLFLSHLIGQPLTLSSNNECLRSRGSANSLLLMKIDCLTKKSGPNFAGCGQLTSAQDMSTPHSQSLLPMHVIYVRTSIFGDQSRLISDITVVITQTCGRVRCSRKNKQRDNGGQLRNAVCGDRRHFIRVS